MKNFIVKFFLFSLLFVPLLVEAKQETKHRQKLEISSFEEVKAHVFTIQRQTNNDTIEAVILRLRASQEKTAKIQNRKEVAKIVVEISYFPNVFENEVFWSRSIKDIKILTHSEDQIFINFLATQENDIRKKIYELVRQPFNTPKIEKPDRGRDKE